MATIAELERAESEARDNARKASEALQRARDQEAAARRAPLQELVKRAHACLCAWNHTDGCGWGYEESAPNPWNCETHNRWLSHYDTMINGNTYNKPIATLEEVNIILTAVEELKPKVKTALLLLRSGKLTP